MQNVKLTELEARILAVLVDEMTPTDIRNWNVSQEFISNLFLKFDQVLDQFEMERNS